MTYQEYKRHLLKIASLNHIPMVGEFELIPACNFNCYMCYVSHGRMPSYPTKEEWLSLFEEAKEAGMLYALLTGGEIFLHPQFIDIYEGLFDMGIKITLYTNGSLLTDEILSSLSKRPPESIIITLYGESNETYKQVTKNASFTEVINNIRRLKKAHLNIGVRTIPLREIYEHLDELIQVVKDENLFLGYFLYVSKGEYDLNQRLTPAELIDFEMRIRNAFSLYEDLKYFDSFKSCSALKSGFYINSSFEMKACALALGPKIKVKKKNFIETFLEASKLWEDITFPHCASCQTNDSCIACKARLQLEDSLCNSYLLDTAKLRKQRE